MGIFNNLSLPKWITPVWNRTSSGQSFYDLTSFDSWAKEGNNLHIAQNHPILTPALLFVSKLFSQAKFEVVRESTSKTVPNDPILKLLRNPNYAQTLPDFLESLMFTQIANGVGVVWTKRNIMSPTTPNSLYVLDYSLIEFPDDMKKGNFINSSASSTFMRKNVKYDKHGENLDIPLNQLMFFYDLPNGTNPNPFVAKSRLDGLKQTLINTEDSLIAKNIILKSNGKELVSGTKDGAFPLSADEKKELENMYNNEYGMSFSRKRGIVMAAAITHKSLHIALRDLGLDESIKVDGNIVYTALHIPKDIISLEAKKTTYNNFKESMVSYLQNEMQSSLDSFTAVFNKILIDSGLRLVGSYEHLPIMQFILIERYKGVNERALALTNLRKAGLPNEMALEMVGLDPTTELAEMVAPADDTAQDEAQDEDNQNEEGDE